MQPRSTVEIELVEDVASAAPSSASPDPVSTGTIIAGVLVVLAVLAVLLRAGSDGSRPAPVSQSASTASIPDDPAGPAPAELDLPVDTSTAGSADMRWHQVWAGSAAAAPAPVVVFTATPSSRRSAPPFMHIVEGAVTTTRALDGPVWLEEPSIEWPGEVLSPFVQTRSSIVYSSDGVVWSQDLDVARPHKRIAEGIRVLAGATADDVWVLGSGGRAVTRVDLSRGVVVEHPAPTGFPLAALGDGLVIRVLEDGRRSYAVWRSDGSTVRIPVESTAELLGVGGDRVVFLDGDILVSFDGGTGAVRTASLDLEVAVRRAAVSPDGRFVALASRPDIVSFSEVQIVEVKTGVVVDRFGPVMDLQLQFVDGTTMQFMAPGVEHPWQVVHRDVTTGRQQAVAGAETPMLWFSEIGGS